MKKFLVVLLILTVVGGIFAQEVATGEGGKLTIGGYVNGGLDFGFASHGKGTDDFADPTLGFYAHDYDSTGVGAVYRLITAYTADNWGMNFRLDARNDKVELNYGFGWISILNNIIKLEGGKVNHGAWATKADIGDDVGEGVGLSVHVKPIDGLDVGLGWYAGFETGSAGAFLDPIKDNLEDLSESLVGDNPKLLDPYVSKLTFGAAYGNDVFGIQGSVAFTNGFKEAYAGFNLSAVPNLSIAADSRIWYNDGKVVKKSDYVSDPDTLALWAFPADTVTLIGNNNNDLAFKVDLKAGYTLGDLNFGALIYFYNEYAHAEQQVISVMPFVSYTIGNIVPYLEVYIGIAGYDNEGIELAIKPRVDFNYGAGRVRVGYVFDMDNIGVVKADDPAITNKILCDFLYSF